MNTAIIPVITIITMVAPKSSSRVDQATLPNSCFTSLIKVEIFLNMFIALILSKFSGSFTGAEGLEPPVPVLETGGLPVNRRPYLILGGHAINRRASLILFLYALHAYGKIYKTCLFQVYQYAAFCFSTWYNSGFCILCILK